MKLGLKRKIVLVFIAMLIAVSALDALLASYFTKRQNQDAAFARLKRDLLTWQDELQALTVQLRTVALSAIGETVALNQLSALKALDYKLAQAVDKNKDVKEAARTLAFSKSVSLNRLHLVLRAGGFSAIAVYIDGKLSHRVSESEVGMFVQRGNGEQAWVKAAPDGNGNLPLRSWPAWEEGLPPAVAASLAPLDGPQVAFTYPSADSMMIEVAVPVEGVMDYSLQQGELSPSELSVIDPRIAGSVSDPPLFAANRPPTPFAAVVFQKRIDLAFLQAVERKTGMWPLLFSPDGRHHQQMGPLNLSLRQLLPDTMPDASAIKSQTVFTGQGSFYVAALPWQFEQQPGFVLGLAASMDSTLQNIRQTVAAILAVTGLILAFSIGVGIFLVGRFIDPIVALTKAVKAIGLVSQLARDRQSDYRLTAENLRPLAISAPGEVGDLAWAFDVMIGELHYLFDSLEQRVQERTAELRSLYQMLEAQNLQLEEQSSELSASNCSLQEEIGERRLMEDLLRLREQEFRSLAENSPDNIARYGLDCRIKYMNARLHATLGITDAAIARACIGKTPAEVFPDGRFDAYEAAVKSVIESGLETEYEAVGADIGDGIRHHLVRMIAERDRHGEVIGVLAMGRDITERKAAEKRLSLLNYALDHVKDSVWLIGEDAHFYHVNKESCNTLGYAYDEILGLSVPNIDPDYQQEHWPDHWRDLKANGSLTFESRHSTKDGRIFPVEINANYFEFDGQGYNLAIGRNITDRKRIEETLKFIAQSGWKEGGEPFLTALARYLGKMLNVDYVIVDKLAEVAGHAETVALYAKGEVLPNMQYNLIGTPCENVMEGELCCYATDVQRQFPEDVLLVEMQVDSYSGLPLWDSSGKVIGLIAVMDGKPIENKAAVTSILQLVATRAAAELERGQSERALAESRQFLKQVIDTIPYPVFVKDREHHWILLNQAFCDFIGHPMESLLGQSDYDFFPAQEADVFWAQDELVFNSGKEAVNEEEFTDRQGMTHNTLTKKICYADDRGRQYLVGIILDITERKRMEAELLGQADFQQTILNAVADAGMQVMMIEEGRIIHVGNRKLAYEFGFSDEEIDNHPPLATIVHPDDWERIQDYYIRRLAGEAVPASYELGLVTRSGERREYETSVAVVPGTYPVRMITVGKDIGERKRMETELKNQADFQQTIINAVCDVGMQLVVIENGRMIHFGNRASAQQFGFTDEDIDAQPPFIDFVHPDDRERVIGYHVSRMKGEAVPNNYELGLVAGNGERREFETSVAVVPGTDPVRLIAIFRDITERKRMEQALVSREQELRALAESSPGMVGSFYARPDGSVCMPYVSANIWELFGLRPEDVADDVTPLLALNHPADAQRVMESIAESARTMTTWHIEFRILHPTCGERWMEGNTNPQPHPDGGIIWYGYVHDVTGRKQAEAEKQRLINILEQSADFIGSADMQGHLLYHNRAARRMVGLPEDADLSNMTIADMHPEWALKMVEEQGIPMLLKDGVWHGETAVRQRDGREIPVSQLLVLHRDADGKPLFHSTIMRDISEHKQAENEIRALNADLERRVLERTEELRRQTNYLRTMIDTLPMMAWFKDKDCRFLVVNQALATACSHSVDDLIGKSDLEVWPHEQAEAYRADDAEVMATGRLKIMEESFIDAHDGAIWVETFKAPVVDEDGCVLGTVGIARDISERRAVEMAREAALAEAERLAHLRSDFMARMSHELRTPLNGILGYTQVLQGENQLDERHGAMVNVIQKSGEHLLSLINDILDFAKIEAGKQVLSLSDVHLPVFLGNIAGIVGVNSEQKQLAFVYEIAGDVPEGIRADEMRLRQVLLNLLSNAVKYTERGEISLTVTALEAGRLRFKVRDTGIGIDNGQLETIFRPFEQAGDSRNHSSGTGLGLLIDMLSRLGFETLVAANGQECLECVGKHMPDLVLLDMVMPEMDGLEAARRLRCLPEFGLTPIIAVSASASGTDIAEALDAGVNAFLSKPIEMKRLMAQISGLLSLDWVYALPEVESSPQHGPDEGLETPPIEEMRVLHRMALEGSMHDIADHAQYLEELDARYRPFAGQLRKLCQKYQSKAILELVEHYINRNSTT
ncbi:MAG: PAS domain S-box protein [Methylobacter sp.]